MKVIDHIKRADRPLISFEITPPERGGGIKKTFEKIEQIKPYNPPFIHVTSRATKVEYENLDEGPRLKVIRRRPGSLAACFRIPSIYGIDSVHHIYCNGASKQGTQDLLSELYDGGMENVFAIQGDQTAYKKIRQDRTVNKYASDLVEQIQKMNQGIYLEELLEAEPTSFCVGVAGYPEKHPAAPNIQTDIRYLKQKVDTGADYIITQMFFDNEKYFRFVDMCRSAGIDVPVIPGITVITQKDQLTTLPERFSLDFPYELSEKIYQADRNSVKLVGIDWATKQVQELIEQRVPGVHFFIFQKPKSIIKVLDNLNLS